MAAVRPDTHRRGAFDLALLTGAAVALALSFWKAEVDLRGLVGAEARTQIRRMVAEMLPPQTAAPFLALMVRPAIETVQISVAGMIIAISIGLPMSLFATSTLTWTGILYERDPLRSRVCIAPRPLPLRSRCSKALPALDAPVARIARVPCCCKADSRCKRAIRGTAGRAMDGAD